MTESSEVVYRPKQPHHCRIIPDLRSATINLPGGPATLPVKVPVDDPPGTVRRCGECGATWIAYRLPPQSGYAPNHVEWRREGRLARWWRERRAGVAHG